MRPARILDDEPRELTRAELNALHGLERTIAGGLCNWLTVGEALYEIDRAGLWRETHVSFEAYLVDRWRMSTPRARELARAFTSNRVAPIRALISKDEIEAYRKEKARLKGRLRGRGGPRARRCPECQAVLRCERCKDDEW